MPPSPEDDTGSLERARERLYNPGAGERTRVSLVAPGERSVPHVWGEERVLPSVTNRGVRQVRVASIFFIATFVFFLVALAAAGYLFYFGGNSVSVDKVTITIQGPTTIAGGDIVPLSLTITNKNPVAIENATIEIDFPDGTRKADNVLIAYPRYTENLGILASGATVTRSVKAIVFGGAGQALLLPVSFSYGTTGSNAAFVKNSSYALAVSSAPLSVSVDTLAETVAGKPLTLTITVRSNASVPLSNVVVAGTFPFGFSIVSSSLPSNNSSFFIGTMTPGTSKTITITGTLLGQNNEQRVFHFTVGTAKSANDQTLGVSYMTQDASVVIAAPFIDTTLALNGDTSVNAVLTPGSRQSVTFSYANTLSTSIMNASVAITLSGSAVDYDSIQTTNGFYRSSDHTVVFGQDTDPSLATLVPGASGIGAFTFVTKAVGVSSPTVTFTISVSGTRIGQTNVPEQVRASVVKTAKVATVVAFSATALHSSGPLGNGGPIPPRANQSTTYTVVWNVQNEGSTVAGGVVSAPLPGYVSYTGSTSGAGSLSYNEVSRTVLWNTGDLAQRASAERAFQISFTPSTSQKGTAPQLTGAASFSGYDRFAGVQVSATAEPVTTETSGDPGYVAANATVQ